MTEPHTVSTNHSEKLTRWVESLQLTVSKLADDGYRKQLLHDETVADLNQRIAELEQDVSRLEDATR